MDPGWHCQKMALVISDLLVQTSKKLCLMLWPWFDSQIRIGFKKSFEVRQRTSIAGRVRRSDGLLVTQTFDNPPGTPIGLLGHVELERKFLV